MDFEWVEKQGREAAAAMDCFERLARIAADGVQGVVYDTALRGVHHQKLLREFGWIPVNKSTAHKTGSSKPRRGKGDQRVEKLVHVEDRRITLANNRSRTLHLYAQGGTIGLEELTDTGELEFTELVRVRTPDGRTRPVRSVSTTITDCRIRVARVS